MVGVMPCIEKVRFGVYSIFTDQPLPSPDKLNIKFTILGPLSIPWGADSF